jgi:GMP synthase (glutamine-hydrolysing)
MEMFTEHLHLPVTKINHADKMLAELKGVVDPEKKRKIIGREFIEVFKAFAEKMEKDLGHKPAFLVQVGLVRRLTCFFQLCVSCG